MKTTYKVMVGRNERMSFQMDSANASAPICLLDEDGERVSTPFQTADARHDEARAADLLNDWSRNEGGEAWGEDEDATVEEK